MWFSDSTDRKKKLVSDADKWLIFDEIQVYGTYPSFWLKKKKLKSLKSQEDS